MRHRNRCRTSCLFHRVVDSFREVVSRPAVDVYRTRTGWLAKFELPGVRSDDIHIRVDGRRLILHAVRRDCVIEEGVHHYSLEITYSPFERELEFPADLRHAHISMDYQAGMLLIRIRTDEERP
jgi:HSP20 family protein